MIDLKFKKFSAKNFLCFGEKGIEVELSNYGNIILVQGCNYDVLDEDGNPSSNGSGKTSLANILVYGLFGKVLKEPGKLNHKNVINNQTGKDMRIEIWWDDYHLVRTRSKTATLRLWKGEEEISKGGIPLTQKLVEEKIGLSYEAFINTVVFTDDNKGSFLECDAAGKREIVENLLSLDKYRFYAEIAKEAKKAAVDTIKLITNSFEHLLTELGVYKRRVAEIEAEEIHWRDNKQKELSVLQQRIAVKQEELKSSDSGKQLAAYEEAQQKIAENNTKLLDASAQQLKYRAIYDETNEKLEKYKLKKQQYVNDLNERTNHVSIIKNAIKTNEGIIHDMQSRNNTKCNQCFGIVDEKNYKDYVANLNNEINEYATDLLSTHNAIESLNTAISSEQEGIDKLSEGSKKLGQLINSYVQSIATLQAEVAALTKVPKPETGVQEQLLAKQISDLHEAIHQKSIEVAGPSPYIDILAKAVKDAEAKATECESKKLELQRAEADLPYYDFAVVAFGDKGIRKFAIDRIRPGLNGRIAYWLQHLIDSKISLTLDNKLEETIERNPPDGDPFVYHGMSGGERRRLNLAISQAFAYIMMLNCGTSPSVIFLDEVSSNVDQMGAFGIYKMIAELAKDKQVFVTTHDRNLLELLEGCERITVSKQGGFSTLK